MKIGKDAPEAKAMPAICYGAPNLYFLFAAMSLFNVRDGGEMVYIIPVLGQVACISSAFANIYSAMV